MTRRLGVLGFVLVLVAMLWPRTADAHEFRPGVLTLIERAPGHFDLRYEPPLDSRRRPLAGVEPRFAEHCRAGTTVVDCDGRGLGRIEMTGLHRHPIDVVVRVQWQTGEERHAVLHGDDDTVELPDRHVGASWAAVAWVYVKLGVEHILIGIDHVLFVLGLTALVGIRKRLLWTVTGFTVAHSVTLALSALGGLTLPSRPVEVGIALSIALLAVEVVDERDTLTRRLPGMVAFAFGLLHGLGFAGALAEIGLPSDKSALALVGFNVGVELGQLGIVAAAAAVAVAWRRTGWPPRKALVPAAYVGGTLAMAWTFDRLLV